MPSMMEDCHSGLTFWKKKFTAPLPRTSFPGDKRRPSLITHGSKSTKQILEKDILESVVNFDSEKHTILETLTSTVCALLYQYTGETDQIITVGAKELTRTCSKNVTGCTLNLVPLRMQVTDSCSFTDVLDQVSKQLGNAVNNLEPFNDIVSEINLPKKPVFNINVRYENAKNSAERSNTLNDTHMNGRLQYNETVRWEMQFKFIQKPDSIRLSLEYCTELFSDQYAECIIDNFALLMKSCSRNQHEPLIQLMPGEETEENETLAAVSILHGPVRRHDESLQDLIMKSLQQHAKTTALIERDGSQTTYNTLLERSMERSLFLREICHLPKQSRIGLLLDNSAETIQYILASLLSGLVYVPMDPTGPKQRLEHVCNEAEIKALIFSRSYIRLVDYLHWTCPSVQTIVCVDSDDSEAIQDDVARSMFTDSDLSNEFSKPKCVDGSTGSNSSDVAGQINDSKRNEPSSENVFTGLQDHIKPNIRVLELNFTSRELHPVRDRYINTSSLGVTTSCIEKLRKKATNVQVQHATPDQIGSTLQGKKFDVIIMNNLSHCFQDHSYLRAVFRACEKLLHKDGAIFLTGVLDLNLKEKLLMSLKSFKESHPNCTVKTNWQRELFLSQDFMQHLCDSSTVVNTVTTSRQEDLMDNDLTNFTFNALFTSSHNSDKLTEENVVNKQVFTCQDVTKAAKIATTDSLHKLFRDWSCDVHRDDEVYVLYTSGTTGTPKGVIIGQEALLNYVTWAADAYQFDPSTTTPFFAPLTFDFTITSIFPPLLCGSVIRILEPFQDSYQTLASSTDITIAKYSPLQLDTILSTSTQPLTASTFIVGGEELTHSLLRKLKNNKGDDKFVIWNEYGPTEATVGCVVRCLTSDELPLSEAKHVPIGKPIDNVTVAVVRNKRCPVSQGAKGHLAIGGTCLCLDFAGDRKKKESKRSQYFRDSCWGKPGEQMLLTCDIVQLLPSSGELVYFGRDSDSQMVKVNGIRVDLMEIQRFIEALSGVLSAWVCTFTHEGHTILGAAVKLGHDRRSDSNWKQGLVTSLKEVLPHRSIPKIFVQLSAAPTNKNGKKDVSFLQKIFLTEINSQKNDFKIANTSSLPSNLEQSLTVTTRLQSIWQSVLPVDRLPNAEDDFFFDLSGDSLQVIHLVRKMRLAGFKVSAQDIFQNPTIKKLAPIVEKRHRTNDSQETPDNEETPFRPTPIVEDYFERSPALKHPDWYSMPALLKFHGKISPEILEKALSSLIKKHGSLRSRFCISNRKVFQQFMPYDANKLNVKKIEIDKSEDHLVNEPVFAELFQKLEQSHSLENGNVVDAAVVNAWDKDNPQKQEHFAFIIIHGAVVDIVSWQQLLEDLSSALRKLTEDENEEPELAKCHVSFQTYCKALHHEPDHVLANQIDYWLGIEQEQSESGKLVEGYPESTFSCAVWISSAIDAKSVRSTSLDLGCSEENMLLTAFGRAMAAIHGHDKTSVCLESHGRQLTSVDSSDTVGWCTSSFPVILHTPPSQNIVDQVRNVADRMKQTPNRGLGFGLLRSRKLLVMPLPKIMFAFQGSIDASNKLIFAGGRFSFEHIPWIEIRSNEMKAGRFHRQPEEFMEYYLQMLAWINGGELKFGCLFDASVINKEVVQDLVSQTQNNMKIIIKETNSTVQRNENNAIKNFPDDINKSHTCNDLSDYIDKSDTMKNISDDTSTSDTTTNHPNYTNKLDTTINLPDGISKSDTVKNLSDTSTSDTTTTLPDYASKSDTTTNLPDDTSKSNSGKNLLDHTSESDTTSTHPDDTSKSNTITNLPDDTRELNTPNNRPDDTSKPDTITNFPDNTSKSDTINQQPDKTSKSDTTNRLPDNASTPDTINYFTDISDSDISNNLLNVCGTSDRITNLSGDTSNSNNKNNNNNNPDDTSEASTNTDGNNNQS